jgi:hypothetical protein
MSFRISNPWILSALLLTWLLGGLPGDVGYAAQAKARAKAPALKIVSVRMAPLPFVLHGTPFTFTILVELPKSIPQGALLDVSTLITSASRSSFRLLSSRQIVAQTYSDDALDPIPQRHVEIVQTWDGIDNNDRIAPEGLYDYQIQAKLLVTNKSGSRLTRMTAWKKKGNFEVKARASARSD